jgi:hypothetical protein
MTCGWMLMISRPAVATVGLKGREWEGIGVEVGDEVVAFRKMTLSLSLSFALSPFSFQTDLIEMRQLVFCFRWLGFERRFRA